MSDPKKQVRVGTPRLVHQRNEPRRRNSRIDRIRETIRIAQIVSDGLFGFPIEAHSIARIHDHKGRLTLAWHDAPMVEHTRLFDVAWRVVGEAFVEHIRYSQNGGPVLKKRGTVLTLTTIAPHADALLLGRSWATARQ